VQVVFQAQAFYINAEAADFLASITEQGNAIDPNSFYVFGDDLRLCHGVPKSFSTSSCQVIWDGMVGNNTMLPTSVVQAMGMNGTTDPLPAIVKVSPGVLCKAVSFILDFSVVLRLKLLQLLTSSTKHMLSWKAFKGTRARSLTPSAYRL
jgi:hypothetical protein